MRDSWLDVPVNLDDREVELVAVTGEPGLDEGCVRMPPVEYGTVIVLFNVDVIVLV